LIKRNIGHILVCYFAVSVRYSVSRPAISDSQNIKPYLLLLYQYYRSNTLLKILCGVDVSHKLLPIESTKNNSFRLHGHSYIHMTAYYNEVIMSYRRQFSSRYYVTILPIIINNRMPMMLKYKDIMPHVMLLYLLNSSKLYLCVPSYMLQRSEVPLITELR